MSLSSVRVCVASILFTCMLSSMQAADSNWPRFRGPDGTGHSKESGIPTKWTDDDVSWRTDLGGQGQSSPVIWGDRVFVTASKANASGAVERSLMSIDRNTGKVQWRRVLATGEGESLHKMNSYATPSCATDGEQVVAFFGNGGLHSCKVTGEKEWSLELGKFPGPWGTGGSPVLLGDMLIQNCDALGEAYLLAVDKKTGKQLWRTRRRELPRGGWSTPFLIDTGKRKELVLNGEFGVQAYAPDTGKDLWYCKSFNGRGTPSPAWGHGMLFVVNGKPGDVYTVRPGGSGDVTDSHMNWHTPRRGGRDLPSPILVGKYLLVVSMGGVASCYDATNGKELWKDRIGGNYSASPFAADGLAYFQNEKGEVIVIKPADKLNIVARNKVGKGGEIFRASPAPSGGQIFIRSDRALYCVGKPAGK